MAINNTPGSFADLSFLASALSSALPDGMTSIPGHIPEAGNVATPQALELQEREVLGSLHAVPLSIRDQLQRTRAQNELYIATIARIRNEMPPLGNKPTAATLAALDRDVDALALAAGGPNTNIYVADVVNSVENYIETAEAAPPQAESPAPEDTAQQEPQTSEPDNGGRGDSGLGLLASAGEAFMAARLIKAVSLTKGGYKQMAPKFGATPAKTVKPGIKPTTPGKPKPPNNNI